MKSLDFLWLLAVVALLIAVGYGLQQPCMDSIEGCTLF